MESKTKKAIPVECWTRTVGYFRPTSQMHKGKQAEVADRLLYDVKKIPEVVNVSRS